MGEYGLEIILTVGRKHHQEFIENFVKRLKNFSINFEMKKKREKNVSGKELNKFYDMKWTSLYGVWMRCDATWCDWCV